MNPNIFQLSVFRRVAIAQGETAREHGRLSFRFRPLLMASSVAIAYYIGTIIGFALTPRGDTISTLWPPNALLLAFLLLAPRRIWWVLVLAVLPPHLIVQLHNGVPLATSLGWFAGNTGEALLGAFCIVQFRKSKPLFDSTYGVVVFLLFGALLAPLVTSFEDAAVVVVTRWGADYWMLWTRRLFSNMLSILTIVPPIVILGSTGIYRLQKIRPAKYAEAGLLVLGIFCVSVSIFGGQGASPNTIPALVYVPLPFLLWAAVRIGPGGLSASLLIVALVSVWEAMHGHGPFTSVSMSENVLYLQILLCVIAVPLMLLAAVLSERQSIEVRLRETNTRLIEAQERERQRIARELHDDVAQQLALAEVQLSKLKADSDLASSPQLERLSDQIAEISNVIREISHGLYPSLLQHLGLAPALRRLSKDICREKALSLDMAKELHPLPPDVSLSLYRIAQEALHNIEKHSNARNVSIELKEESGRVVLRVVDDGVGFGPEREFRSGMGLASIRERMRSIGGTVQISSSPMRGTRIEASVPLDEARPTGVQRSA
jgi:two-component system sensor histidine kinase UhpB